MIVTEQEAMQRWCPFGRQFDVYQVPGTLGGSPMLTPAFNRKPHGDIPACIASSCMAWRWLDPKGLREIDMVTEDVVDEAPRRGYCGLSGIPREV